MKLLVCSSYYYYGHTQGIEPQFYYLYQVPQSMGHQVDFFDFHTAAKIGVEQMRRSFLAGLRGGAYDAVFIATFKDEFDQETLAEARKYCPIIAWNSDDEWRWKDYSEPRINWYSFMVTNSPDVYAENKNTFPNLLHAQWACTGFWNGLQTKKDLNFSFAGMVYGKRAEQTQWLGRHAGLQTFGFGSKNFALASNSVHWKKLIQNAAFKLFPLFGGDLLEGRDILSFDRINGIWNRSKISFTPLDSSQGEVRQIKSRVFDMGLSGTLMLAHRAPHLDEYYEPGCEYIPFDSLEECTDKARYFLSHEAERQRIAEAYAKRTQAEHMWKSRLEAILTRTGLMSQDKPR